jgi:HEAT repeat protein
MRAPTRRFLMYPICALALLAASCAGPGGGGRSVGVEPAKPKEVPPPAPPRDVPVDPALQAAAKDVLNRSLSASDPVLRAHAIEGLRETQGESAGPRIVQAMSDGSPVVRFAAAFAAGELRLASARERLNALLNDQDGNVRVAARYALHRLGDKRHSHDLEISALDPDVRVRVSTALVLGRMGEPSARKILKQMRKDPNPAVRQQASESLWHLGDSQGYEDLVGLTASKYPDDEMIGYLGLMQHPENLPESTRETLAEIARSGLSADWDEVKLVAARALAEVADIRGPYDLGYDIATRGAQSSDPRQRVLGALALGAIGRTDAQDTLRPLLQDQNPDTQIAAATALLQIGKTPRNAPSKGKR